MTRDIEKIKDRIAGCLWGQAIGDALGLGTEFMSRDEVLHNYPEGLSEYSQIVQDFHRERWCQGDWCNRKSGIHQNRQRGYIKNCNNRTSETVTTVHQKR